MSDVKLPVDKIKIDRTYQRKKHFIKDKFSPSLAGALLVADRDGEYYVYDGQGRLLTAIRDGFDKVLCKVTPSKGRKWEAQQYLLANKQRAQRPYDKYHAGISAEDETYLKIDNVLARHGFVVSESDGENTVRGIGTLKTLCTSDFDLFKETIAVAASLPKDHRNIFSSKFLGGLFYFLKKYSSHPYYCRDRLVRRLSDCNIRRDILCGSLSGGYAANSETPGRIREMYNYRCRNKKLPY